MRQNIFISLLAIVMSFTLLQAQGAAPLQGPERAKLAFLIGTYTTETHMMSGRMGGKGAAGKGTSVLAWGVDSMFVILDDQSVNQLLGNYKAHGILGYDMHDSEYVLSMFNNFGDTPQYRGTFKGDTLVLLSRVNFPGGSFDQKLLWYKDGSSIQLKIFNDMGKGFVQVIDQKSTPQEVHGK